MLHVALLAWLVVRHCRQVRSIFRLTMALAGLLVVQLLLGRVDLDRQVCGARLGRGLASRQRLCQYGQRLAADPHHHGPRGVRLAAVGDFRRDGARGRCGNWPLLLRVTKARRLQWGPPYDADHGQRRHWIVGVDRDAAALAGDGSRFYFIDQAADRDLGTGDDCRCLSSGVAARHRSGGALADADRGMRSLPPAPARGINGWSADRMR